VRRTLYKLYSEKLAQFRRIRDKSTGWFIYYWWHDKKYNFDEAFELNFRCPDCGSPLKAQDNEKIIDFLRSRIVMIQNIKISVD
jgi:transcription initiation factor TFIIE subunit alpha